MHSRNSLAVQWLGPCALTAEGPGSVSGRGANIPQASWHGQRKKRKENVLHQKDGISKTQVSHSKPKIHFKV